MYRLTELHLNESMGQKIIYKITYLPLNKNNHTRF